MLAACNNRKEELNRAKQTYQVNGESNAEYNFPLFFNNLFFFLFE